MKTCSSCGLSCEMSAPTAGAAVLHGGAPRPGSPGGVLQGYGGVEGGRRGRASSAGHIRILYFTYGPVVPFLACNSQQPTDSHAHPLLTFSLGHLGIPFCISGGHTLGLSPSHSEGPARSGTAMYPKGSEAPKERMSPCAFSNIYTLYCPTLNFSWENEGLNARVGLF